MTGARKTMRQRALGGISSMAPVALLMLGLGCEGDQPCPPPNGFCVTEAEFALGVVGEYTLEFEGGPLIRTAARCPGGAGDTYEGTNIWVWSCYAGGLVLRDAPLALPDGPFDLTLAVKQYGATKTGVARFPAAKKQFDGCGNCYPRTARVDLRP